MLDNDDELNFREMGWGREDDDTVVVASLFYPFNVVRLPTISLSVIARSEYEEFVSKLQRREVWLYKMAPRMMIKNIKDLESWILEA